MKEPKQRVLDPKRNQIVSRINTELRKNKLVLATRIKGERRYVFFNPKDPRSARAATALKNLDAQDLGTTLGMIAKVTRWMASVNTQYNPIFGPYNFLRDMQSAALQLSTTELAGQQKEVAANVVPSLKVIYSSLRKRRKGEKAEGELASSAGAGGADEATDGALRLPTAETIGAAAAHVSKMCDLVGYCIKALERGVTRGHLLPPVPGALIQELYTTDGCGTLIARDVYDGIRLATAADVPGILALIGPLEAQGVLIKRSPDVLARDVHLGFYYVYTRDDTIVACAQLKRYSDTHAEVGCLVVNDQYRRQGCGDAMLGFLERTAAAAGVERLFALSTHTMQWFIERGFASCALVDLPPRRIAIYNHTRGSKIYMKPLQSARLLDAEELFWQGTLGRPKQGTRIR
jgi:N-acetylglutamate synthase-like GNAT family acetyltransferase